MQPNGKETIIRYSVVDPVEKAKTGPLRETLGEAIKDGMCFFRLRPFMVIQLTSSVVYDSAESAPKADPKQVN